MSGREGVAAGVPTLLRARLANGLEIVGERRPGLAVALALVFEVGARDEAADEAGAAHLLEHLAFKGDGERDADAVNEGFDALGATVNATTSHDRTAYVAAALADVRAPLTERLFALARPALREHDVAVERQVVLEEIAMVEDQPADRAFDRAVARYFAGHPLGMPVLGTTAAVAALDAARLRAFHERWYAAGRALLVVAGAFDAAAVVAQAEALSADWPAIAPGRAYPTPTPRRGAEEEEAAAAERAYLHWFAPAPAAQDRDRTAAELLARVLGDPGHGRLRRALVEPGWVDDASAWYEPADGVGTFLAALDVDDARFDRVLEIAEATIERFAREGPSDDEWARAQRALATDLTLHAETPAGRVAELADDWRDHRRLESGDAAVRRVLATPRAAGSALLEAGPFAARFRHATRPARRRRMTRR